MNTVLHMTLPTATVHPKMAILVKHGLEKAFDIFTTDNTDKFEENTIRDIVGRLMRYGSISDKQIAFVKALLDKITNRAAIEAKREVERLAAKPVPTTEDRVIVKGKVLSIKENFGRFGGYKMLIEHADGYKLYGSLPKALSDVEKGDTVEFLATIKISDRDDRFGFFNRPTKARIVK